jgi:hypothetical protein
MSSAIDLYIPLIKTVLAACRRSKSHQETRVVYFLPQLSSHTTRLGRPALAGYRGEQHTLAEVLVLVGLVLIALVLEAEALVPRAREHLALLARLPVARFQRDHLLLEPALFALVALALLLALRPVPRRTPLSERRTRDSGFVSSSTGGDQQIVSTAQAAKGLRVHPTHTSRANLLLLGATFNFKVRISKPFYPVEKSQEEAQCNPESDTGCFPLDSNRRVLCDGAETRRLSSSSPPSASTRGRATE